MSATIAECGHDSCFIETDFMSNSPQVHIHYLADDDFFEEYGYGRVELCCHGCASSILMYYSESTSKDNRHIKVRDKFRSSHKKCVNHDYERRCPGIRLGIQVVDLRAPLKKVEKRPLTRIKKTTKVDK